MALTARRASANAPSAADLTVALCGNPNCGKTTLFNALTGLSLKVANYPGVTVEKVSGLCHLGDRRCRLIDIPGSYSLAARSPDETIATEALLGRVPGEPRPDVVVVVIDATQLDRGLYLVSQILELGIPTVVTLNMFDLAQRRGIRVDLGALSSRLGVPVVPMVARRREGIEELKSAIGRAARADAPTSIVTWPGSIVALIDELGRAANTNGDDPLSHGELVRLLFDEQPVRQTRMARERGPDFVDTVERERQRLASEGGVGLEVSLRTQQVATIVRGVAERPGDRDASWTSRLDRVLLHRFGGPLIMGAIMVAVFQSIFVWAQPLIEWVDLFFGVMSDTVRVHMAAGPLQSLIADGLIGGVGSVLVFLPQILILFFFIGVLEDSGYMPRAAFLVDRLFKGFGLTGRSLIPLLSSFACAVPGIMATRTIDQRGQRLLTMLVAPLMTCSARLPVYAILIAAFVPAVYVGIFSVQGLALAGLYVLGLVVAALVAIVLKHTILRGPASSFVMELPSYKVPRWPDVFAQMFRRGQAFVVRAGTVILALTVVLWALSYYPRSIALDQTYGDRIVSAESAGRLEEARQLEREQSSAQLQNSYLGRMGRFLEPASVHLGWDWKITMAVMASFPAREVLIATLGTIYNLGDEGALESTLLAKLRHARWDHGPLAGRPVFNLAVAASVMVFFALCCQCMATLATIRRETNSWQWPIFVFVYMTVLATGGAFLTYRVGLWLGLGGVA